MISIQIVLFGFLSTINGFDLKCPHQSQRTARIQSVCNGNSSAYTCLYDTRKKGYVEFCANRKDNYVRAGLKYVISGTFRNVRCSEGRYQPVRFWSNQSSVCMNLKSKCNGFGEIVYNNISSINDATCRCDYTRGYAFVSKPRNKCFCVPLEEDCSCYIKECSTNTSLSPDYECNYIGLMKDSFYCEHVNKRADLADAETVPLTAKDRPKADVVVRCDVVP
ncbi:Hypothetical predicted protein [Mytilus galloprovincialis]|uniref:Uncharacterized protein n=1 Tax=Mytilus galloprovincialis TaxID=29158 RepID=A0A8B6H7I3_MYTGA|nr:Hypothetical predicted protein [Mytilus galloprovincialis]